MRRAPCSLFLVSVLLTCTLLAEGAHISTITCLLLKESVMEFTWGTPSHIPDSRICSVRKQWPKFPPSRASHLTSQEDLKVPGFSLWLQPLKMYPSRLVINLKTHCCNPHSESKAPQSCHLQNMLALILFIRTRYQNKSLHFSPLLWGIRWSLELKYLYAYHISSYMLRPMCTG